MSTTGFPNLTAPSLLQVGNPVILERPEAPPTGPRAGESIAENLVMSPDWDFQM